MRALASSTPKTRSPSWCCGKCLCRLPVAGSTHAFKYRLAYVVDGVCVVRYDNEVGKGDHRHFGDEESDYSFTTLDALVAAFELDIARWDRENSDS